MAFRIHQIVGRGDEIGGCGGSDSCHRDADPSGNASRTLSPEGRREPDQLVVLVGAGLRRPG